MPWVRPSRTEIIDRIRADLSARLLPDGGSAPRRSSVDTLAVVEGGAVHLLYGFLDYMAKQPFEDTADAEFLERRARMRGITRKSAVAAAGSVLLTGTDGAVVPAGAELSRADGALFTLAAAAAIAGGQAVAEVTASVAGADGNTAAGVSLSLVSPVPGVQSAAAVQADGLAGGYDEETDEELRARVLERMRQTPQGGNKDDYERWAKEVAGVTRAWCKPLWLGLGTVGVIVVCDNQAGTIVPTAEKLAEVQAYVDALRPVTATHYVLGPTLRPVDYTISITPDTPEIRAAVADELAALFSDQEPGGTAYLSQVREAVSTSAGETDNTVDAPEGADAKGNVTAEAHEILTLGVLTWGG